MRQRYKHSIEAFCRDKGITIPPAFYRHATSRYAAIDLTLTPPKLVASTWLNKEAVKFYVNNLPAGARVRILDFHDNHEMDYDGFNVSRGRPIQ